VHCCKTKEEDEAASGLPDGIVSYQKSQFGYILEDLGMENVGILNGHLPRIFYGHWVYFEVILYIF
jgi:hypothetical protein